MSYSIQLQAGQTQECFSVKQGPEFQLIDAYLSFSFMTVDHPDKAAPVEKYIPHKYDYFEDDHDAPKYTPINKNI